MIQQVFTPDQYGKKTEEHGGGKQEPAALHASGKGIFRSLLKALAGQQEKPSGDDSGFPAEKEGSGEQAKKPLAARENVSGNKSHHHIIQHGSETHSVPENGPEQNQVRILNGEPGNRPLPEETTGDSEETEPAAGKNMMRESVPSPEKQPKGETDQTPGESIAGQSKEFMQGRSEGIPEYETKDGAAPDKVTDNSRQSEYKESDSKRESAPEQQEADNKEKVDSKATTAHKDRQYVPEPETSRTDTGKGDSAQKQTETQQPSGTGKTDAVAAGGNDIQQRESDRAATGDKPLSEDKRLSSQETSRIETGRSTVSENGHQTGKENEMSRNSYQSDTPASRRNDGNPTAHGSHGEAGTSTQHTSGKPENDVPDTAAGKSRTEKENSRQINSPERSVPVPERRASKGAVAGAKDQPPLVSRTTSRTIRELGLRRGPVKAVESGEVNREAVEEQKKLFADIFTGQKGREALGNGPEIINTKSEKGRSERYKKHVDAFSDRTEDPGTSRRSGTVRPALLRGDSLPANGQPAETAAKTFSASAGSEPDANGESSEKENAWKEVTSGALQTGNEKQSETNASSFARLGQIPITNVALREKVLPGLTKVISAAAGNKTGSGGWQQHHVVLEDGKNLRLSTRQTDGVLQVKLGSSNQELNRLLQQYQNEIREHLQKECGVEIDLQFGNEHQQSALGFFGESYFREGNNKSRNHGSPPEESLSTESKTFSGDGPMRKFGYNRKEWTA